MFTRRRLPRGLRSGQKNAFSQKGEDAIAGYLLKRAKKAGVPVVPWCCEFGAWDGKHLSNTYRLIVDHGFHGVYIESDPEKYQDLLQTVAQHPDQLIGVQRLVGWKPADDTLDVILAETPIPRDFFCLSVDVDGPDYWIWAALENYEPRVVIIETHSVYAPPESVIYEEGIRHGDRGGSTSFAPMVALGLEKNYVPVAYTGNLVLCHREFYDAALADLFPSDFEYDELYHLRGK